MEVKIVLGHENLSWDEFVYKVRQGILVRITENNEVKFLKERDSNTYNWVDMFCCVTDEKIKDLKKDIIRIIFDDNDELHLFKNIDEFVDFYKDRMIEAY